MGPQQPFNTNILMNALSAHFNHMQNNQHSNSSPHIQFSLQGSQEKIREIDLLKSSGKKGRWENT